MACPYQRSTLERIRTRPERQRRFRKSVIYCMRRFLEMNRTLFSYNFAECPAASVRGCGGGVVQREARVFRA